MKLLKKLTTSILLTLLLVSSLTGCGTTQPQSEEKHEDTQYTSEITTVDATQENTQEDTQEETQEIVQEEQNYFSEILTPEERTIWYTVKSMESSEKVSCITLMENGTLTKAYIGSLDLKLSDIADMTDDEVAQVVNDAIATNEINYIKYDTSNIQKYLYTDSTGNAVQETLLIPPSAIKAFKVNFPCKSLSYALTYTYDVTSPDCVFTSRPFVMCNYGAVNSTYFAGYYTSDVLFLTKVADEKATLTYYTDDMNDSSIKLDEDISEYVELVDYLDDKETGEAKWIMFTELGKSYYFENAIINDNGFDIFKEGNSILPLDDSMTTEEIDPEDLNNNGIADRFEHDNGVY